MRKRTVPPYNSSVDDWYVFEYHGTAGERCDVALTLMLRELLEFASLSRTRVQALIEGGGLLCDGKEITGNWRNLRPGVRIEVNLGALRELVKPLASEHVTPYELPLNFLHVDDYLAVVEKPCGIAVHPSPTDPGPTLAGALLYHLGTLSDVGGAGRPGIVHRLDRETSGLLVIARNNLTHADLSRQFHDRLVEKEYLALCVDAPYPPAGRIDLPIERHPAHRQKMLAVEKRFGGLGRDALTEYRVAGRWGPLTLADVAIHTGRTHQIRVHLLTVGATILGDTKYGLARNRSLYSFLETGVDRGAKRWWRQAWPDEPARRNMLTLIDTYPGIFLHSRRLAFTHPATGAALEFTLAPPETWDHVRESCLAHQPESE